VTLPSCSLLKEEPTLLRKVPDSSGADMSAVISLCVFLQVFVTGFILSSTCKVSLFSRFFKPLLLRRTRVFSLIKMGFTFESKISVALFGLG
jgi:hypothetical protein